MGHKPCKTFQNALNKRHYGTQNSLRGTLILGKCWDLAWCCIKPSYSTMCEESLTTLEVWRDMSNSSFTASTHLKLSEGRDPQEDSVLQMLKERVVWHICTGLLTKNCLFLLSNRNCIRAMVNYLQAVNTTQRAHAYRLLEKGTFWT